MRRTYLGEFEEIVLLTVAILGDGAYGVAITEEIEQQAGRSVSISAVHAALQRLEEKEMLSSYMGDATAERGGRRAERRERDEVGVADRRRKEVVVAAGIRRSARGSRRALRRARQGRQ